MVATWPAVATSKASLCGRWKRVITSYSIHYTKLYENGLENILSALETGQDEVQVDAELMERARIPLQRMLDFQAR